MESNFNTYCINRFGGLPERTAVDPLANAGSRLRSNGVELSAATNRLPTPEAYQQTLQYMQHTTQVSAVREAVSTYRATTTDTVTDDLKHLAQLRADAIALSREWQVAFGTLNTVSTTNQSLHRSQSEPDSQIKLAVEWSPFQKAVNGEASDSQASVVAPASYVDSGAATGVKTASANSAAKINEGQVDLFWDTHPLVALVSERSESSTVQEGRSEDAGGDSVRLMAMLNANRSARLWSQLLSHLDQTDESRPSNTTIAAPLHNLKAGIALQRPYGWQVR